MPRETTNCKVAELLALLNEIAPFERAESWDNVGLLVGHPGQEISKILVGLDPTEGLLDEAVASGCNTVITHHPLIFHPLKQIRTDQAVGRLIQKALQYEIAVIGCHTNLDIVVNGVNDALADKIGLLETRPLLENDAGTGFGRIGRLAEPLSDEHFLPHLMHALEAASVAIAGQLPATITTMAVCGGSGSDLAEQAFKGGAQVYVSAEIKHSVARWAEAVDFCIIDAGHYVTENPVVPVFATLLAQETQKNGMKMDILANTSQQSPFRHILNNHGKLIYS